MKKFILFSILSVLFYSAPGYTMPGGGEAAAEENLKLKFTRARDLMPALREMTKKDSDQEEECQLRETLDLLLGDI